MSDFSNLLDKRHAYVSNTNVKSPETKYNYRFSLEMGADSLIDTRVFESVIKDALLLYHAKTGQEFWYKNFCLCFDNQQTLMHGYTREEDDNEQGK